MRYPRLPLILLVCLGFVVLRASTTLGQATPSVSTPAAKDRQTASRLQAEALSLFYLRERKAYQQAIVKWRQAADLWQAIGDHQQEGKAWLGIGRTFYIFGEHKEALTALHQAAKAFHDAGDKVAEGRCWFEVATTHGSMVEFSQALQFHFRGAALWQIAQEPELPLITMFQLGRAQRLSGDWDKARSVLKQLQQAARAFPEPGLGHYYEQQAFSELGYVAVGAERPREALGYFEKALPYLLNDSERPYDPPFVLSQMAQAWLQLNQSAKAYEAGKQALDYAQRLGQIRGEAVALSVLGQVYTAQGRLAQAQKVLTRAQALILASRLKRDQPMVALRLAQLAQQQGELPKALKQVELALSAIDEIRAGIPPANDMRATYWASWGEAQSFQLDLLMKMHQRQPQAGYDKRAFEVAEAAQARSLIELMLEANADIRDNFDPQLIARMHELQQRVARNPPASELAHLLAEYGFANAELRTRNPRLASLVQRLPHKLNEVQQEFLDDRTLLFEYAPGPERSWLFVVSHQCLHVFALPARAVIERQARRYYELMMEFSQPPVFNSIAEKQKWQTRMERKERAVALALSRLLLAPAHSVLTDQRLVIVPSTTLSYVPFAALPVASETRETSNHSQATDGLRPVKESGQPLIARHEMIVLPSVSTLGALRRANAERPKAPKTLALFADPVFAPSDARVPRAPAISLQPELGPPLMANAAFFNGAVPAGGKSLLRLPDARREAEAIAAFVSPDQRLLALDFEASRDAVLKAELSQYRYVHFATHGVLDNDHPELSSLALSSVSRHGESQDGFLRTMDVFSLKLNAELVVLSGCQTALGKEVRGEGLMGLSRSFMYAGARRVLASLWRVNDQATAELMQRLYARMLGPERLPAAAALRAAQLSLWRDKRWQSPYFWAAFTLQGEW